MLNGLCRVAEKTNLISSEKSANQSNFCQGKNVENLSPKATFETLYTSRLLCSVEKISITLKSMLIKGRKVEKEGMENKRERKSQ